MTGAARRGASIFCLPLGRRLSAPTENPSLPHTAAKACAAALRAYYRHVPLRVGKQAVWNRLVYRLLRSGAELHADTCFGARMQVRFPDTIQSYVYFFGVWEPAITAYLMGALSTGDTVIDVGANVGYDSLLAAHCVGPAGRVFAIEASPSVFRTLQQNLALNAAIQVTAVNAAACAEPGPVPIWLHAPDNVGGSTIVPSVAQRRRAALEATVPGRPLADLVPEPAICGARLIKIDVEGAEYAVVRGIRPLLPSLSPRTELLIEVSAEALYDHGCSAADFLAIFREAGFRPFAIDNRYSVDMYLAPAELRLTPVDGADFDQLDILFRRTA